MASAISEERGIVSTGKRSSISRRVILSCARETARMTRNNLVTELDID
jgi:hypothetical protein